MKLGTLQERLARGFRALLTVLCLVIMSSSADAQLLYSFEPDLEGWALTGYTGSDAISVSHSTLGATNGTHSMAVERGKAILPDTNGFSWDVVRSVTPTVLPNVYSTFQSIADDPTKYALDFDVTFTPESFADVAHIAPFFAIQAFVNSSTSGENNFNQTGNLTPVGGDDANLMDPNLMDPSAGTPKLGTHYFSIPLSASLGGTPGALYLAPNSTYYQLNIGSNLTNSLFTNGPNGEGAVYFVDNIRFRELPDLVPETIFSWETDDVPETTVNEQLEGWTEGFQPGHVHSITTTGATDGDSALQIHRLNTGTTFQWASRIVLQSDINSDPEIEEIDPVIQAKIDELTTKIEAADRIAFDVTFDPSSFDGSPTFTRFGMYFQDPAGFYDAEFANFNMLSFTEETTLTMELPLTAFATASSVLLTDVGFVDNLNSFAIGISTNLDGLSVGNPPVDTPIDFQIDNLRLITEISALEGDYNADGTVDAADYVVWRKNVGTNNVLPNDPDGGTIGPDQYATWQANFGANSGGGGAGGGEAAVPEPSALLLVFVAAVAGVMFGRGRE